MGTPTQYYVDTVDGDDGNAGTSPGSGNAWATLKHAIETGITRDTTNGDQINVYAPVGTPDDYSTGDPAIAISSYAAAATADASLIIRGVESDGSTPAIAYLTCSGRYLILDTAFDCCRLINLSIVGGSATGLFELDRNILIYGCLFDNTAGGAVVSIDGADNSAVYHSDIQGASGNAYLLNMQFGGLVVGNYIHERANSCRGVNNCAFADGNIVHLNSTNANGSGFLHNNSGANFDARNNIILNDAAGVTGGIDLLLAGGRLTNNYIEGWSGTGGYDIKPPASGNIILAAHNRSFNNTNDFAFGDVDLAIDNSVTSASGVTDRAAGNYAPTSELREIGYPLVIGGTTAYLNVGAVQNAFSSSGGTGYSRARVVNH